MKKTIIYFISIIFLVNLNSCLEDKNVYDYIDINELDGSIQNLGYKYNISVNEELELTPTFKFTIDKENPDVSYEWRLDGELLENEKDATLTISFSESGLYEITYSVVDNKTGIKFSANTNITVRSQYLRGWLILSEGAGGASELSFIGGQNVKKVITVDNYPRPIERDSIIYGAIIERNIAPGIGKNPTGIFLNAGYVSAYNETPDVADNVIIKQDKWAELNGKTLKPDAFTEDEFRGDLPEAGFSPIAAAMTFSAKALLNSDGYIYWANNAFIDDYHSSIYVSVPLNNSQKFTGIYPSYKLNMYHTAIPAVTVDNSIVGIIDAGNIQYGTTSISENSIRLSSEVVYVMEREGQTPMFRNIRDKKIIDIVPASYEENNDHTIARPGWVALLKDTNTGIYELRYFVWDINTRGLKPTITIYDNNYKEIPLKEFTAFCDIAVFNNKKAAVIADGNILYYYQYGANRSAQLIELKTFDNPITSLAVNDMHSYYSKSSVYLGEYPAHMSVALDDGTFWIYELVETKEKVENGIGLASNATLKQVFPDPKTVKDIDNNFGKIVDTMYKIGNLSDYIEFSY